jgi:hypothetical protein
VQRSSREAPTPSTPHLASRGISKAALARRQETAQKARVKRGLKSPLVRRDFASLNRTHESTSSVSYGDDKTLLFSDNFTCILQPEVTVGPYYVGGELIRSDITDGQEGVPLYLDIQLVDTSTCEPLPAVYMDIWHCNATGVYSGVVAPSNGNSDDLSNVDATFLRGRLRLRRLFMRVVVWRMRTINIRAVWGVRMLLMEVTILRPVLHRLLEQQ